MKKLHTLLLTVLIAALNFTTSKAQSSNYGNISYQKATNISGKQRMLSQRIAKVHLLKLAGATGTELNQEYTSSIRLFQRNLSILTTNSKENSPKVKALIRKEERGFEKLKTALRNSSVENVNTVMNTSNELLQICHSLVLAIEEDSKYTKEYSNESESEQLKVNTVNLSGKQRMLSQRLCLYYTACRLYKKEKLDAKGMCVKVEKLYKEMNNSLNSLLINDLNSFSIEEDIGKILGLFEIFENQKRDLFNNKLPLKTIMTTTNKITNLYNVVTGKYSSL